MNKCTIQLAYQLRTQRTKIAEKICAKWQSEQSLFKIRRNMKNHIAKHLWECNDCARQLNLSAHFLSPTLIFACLRAKEANWQNSLLKTSAEHLLETWASWLLVRTDTKILNCTWKKRRNELCSGHYERIYQQNIRKSLAKPCVKIEICVE